MKVIVELVRGLFALSVTALFGSVLLTVYWLFIGRVRWNPTSSYSNNVNQAYATLRPQAWATSHVWLLVDIGLVVVTLLLGQLWRYCARVINRRKPD